VFEEVWVVADNLDTQAFASTAMDKDSVELIPLDTLQHGLGSRHETDNKAR
jgi:hypothetical protein